MRIIIEDDDKRVDGAYKKLQKMHEIMIYKSPDVQDTHILNL